MNRIGDVLLSAPVVRDSHPRNGKGWFQSDYDRGNLHPCDVEWLMGRSGGVLN